MATKKKKTTGRKPKTTAKQIKDAKAIVAQPTKKDAPEKTAKQIKAEKQDRFGRPTVITQEVLARLLEAFIWGCSNKEAALNAGISERTLDAYNKKDVEFKEHCEELKLTPVLKSRATFIQAAEKSAYYALKLLERLKSDEFSQRVRATFDDPEPLSPEEKEAFDNVFDENL